MTLAVTAVLRMIRSPDISDASTDAIRSLEMMALTSRAEAAPVEAGVGLWDGFTCGPQNLVRQRE